MKATMILKQYFGLKDDQTLSQFAEEIRALKASGDEPYRWVVTEAAKELGVEPEFAS